MGTARFFYKKGFAKQRLPEGQSHKKRRGIGFVPMPFFYSFGTLIFIFRGHQCGDVFIGMVSVIFPSMSIFRV